MIARVPRMQWDLVEGTWGLNSRLQRVETYLPTSAKYGSGVSIAPPHFDSAHLWRGRRQSHELKKAMSENGKHYLHETKDRLKEENLTASLPLKHVREESIERGIQAYSTVSLLSHPDHRSWPILQVFSLSIQNARDALLMVALHSTRRRTLSINIASTSALCTGQGEDCHRSAWYHRGHMEACFYFSLLTFVHNHSSLDCTSLVLKFTSTTSLHE